MFQQNTKSNKKPYRLIAATLVCAVVFSISQNYVEDNAISTIYAGNDSAPIIEIPEPSMIDDILQMLGVGSTAAVA